MDAGFAYENDIANLEDELQIFPTRYPNLRYLVLGYDFEHIITGFTIYDFNDIKKATKFKFDKESLKAYRQQEFMLISRKIFEKLEIGDFIPVIEIAPELLEYAKRFLPQ